MAVANRRAVARIASGLTEIILMPTARRAFARPLGRAPLRTTRILGIAVAAFAFAVGSLLVPVASIAATTGVSVSSVDGLVIDPVAFPSRGDVALTSGSCGASGTT